MIDANELRRLQTIFQANGWNPSEDLIHPPHNFFDAVAQFLSGVEKKNRELVYSLLEKYERIVNYRPYLRKFIDLFGTIYDPLQQHYFIPVSPPDAGRIKSGHAFLYELYSTFQLGGFDKIVDVDSPTSSKLIDIAKSTVIFVDDFVGTGDQFLDKMYPQFLRRNGKPKRAFLMVIRILEEGLKNISAAGINVLADDVRPKAISSGYAIGSLQIADAIESYGQIENVVDVPHGYSFGYGKSEAIISMKKTPDNTLPIFWLTKKKGGDQWHAPFPK